jgi:CBS domain-containing protein
LGRVSDVVAENTGGPELPVRGLLIALDHRRAIVPAAKATVLDDVVQIDATVVLDNVFQRGPADLQLAADVLGHRLLDLGWGRLVRGHDIALTLQDDRWVVAAVDIEWDGWWYRLKRRLNAHHAHRRWEALEPLTTTDSGPAQQNAAPALGRLKVAHIADLLEHASEAEEIDILADLKSDPELEADVYEELAPNHSARLLGKRSDGDVAAVLARMRSDTAADTIATLPHDRLVKVLNLLPAHQRVRVSMLLGYNPTTAGGLMGVDFVAVDCDCDAGQALQAVAQATDVEPQALSTVYLLGEQARLYGAVTLAGLVQAVVGTPVAELAESNPVCVHPDADTSEVAVLMCDHNLLSLPVTDSANHLIGVITVDDVLDATVPVAWRRRMITPATPFAPPEAS